MLKAYVAQLPSLFYSEPICWEGYGFPYNFLGGNAAYKQTAPQTYDIHGDIGLYTITQNDNSELIVSTNTMGILGEVLFNMFLRIESWFLQPVRYFVLNLFLCTLVK